MSNIEFSLAITTYNRANILIPKLQIYEQYSLLSEIIVIDDYSEDYNILQNKTWSNKIKIQQNNSNLGAYKNKLLALSKTSKDKVLLLDSDNFFTEEYLRIIKKESEKNTFDNITTYMAEQAAPVFNYSHLSNQIIDKTNWNKIYPKDACFLNTGNQVFPRSAINCLLSNAETDDTVPLAIDAMYINYILVKNNFKIKCVKNLSYDHNISKDSLWTRTSINSTKFLQNFQWDII